MYYGSWRLEQDLTFTCNAHSISTAGEIDADSFPTYRVYKNEVGTPLLTGTMAKLDDANTTGFYAETITLAAASGFVWGGSYHVRINGVIGGVAVDLTHNFQIGASVDLNWILGALLSESVAGYLAAGFKKLFNVAAPVDGTKLSRHLDGVQLVVVGAGSTTSAVVLNSSSGIDGAAPSSSDDVYNGRAIIFTTGTAKGQATSVSDYVGSTKTLTVVGLATAPTAGDLGILV